MQDRSFYYIISAPLNGSGRLSRYIIDNSACALDLVDDPRGHAPENTVGYLREFTGHKV